jgi:hypothetical protein
MSIYGYIEKQKKDLYIEIYRKISRISEGDFKSLKIITLEICVGGVRSSSEKLRNSRFGVFSLRLVKARLSAIRVINCNSN